MDEVNSPNQDAQNVGQDADSGSVGTPTPAPSQPSPTEPASTPAPGTPAPGVPAPGTPAPGAPASGAQPAPGAPGAAASPVQTGVGAPGTSPMPSQPAPGAPGTPGTAPGTAPYGAPQTQVAVKDTAPLVLGILSIVLAGVVGLILGIIGINKSNTVLKQAPTSSKAKAGRITSIIGIIVSIIATIIAIVLIVGGFSLFNQSGPTAAADAEMSSICMPSTSDRQSFADEMDAGFTSSAGFSMEEMGVDPNDVVSFLFDGVTYTRGEVSIDNDTATVTYTVTSNDLTALINGTSEEIDNLSDEEIASAASGTDQDVYRLVGTCFNRAMDNAQPTEKTVTVHLTKENGEWTVDESYRDDITTQIFIGDMNI